MSNSLNHEIAAMSEEDIVQVVMLGNATPELWPADDPVFYSEETLRHWIQEESGIALTAKCKGTFAGFLLGEAGLASRDGQVHCIAVAPEFRSYGLGGKLLDEALRRLGVLGCNYFVSLIKPDNTASLKLHSKHGFTQGGDFAYTYLHDT